MNEPSSASRTPFIIILILLLAITGVQYFFNFNGLGTDAAMDHAQIARNVARGQGMTTNWLRPIQMVSGSTRAGLNPFLSDAQIHEQEAIRAGQGETLRRSGKIQSLCPPGHTQRSAEHPDGSSCLQDGRRPQI